MIRTTLYIPLRSISRALTIDQVDPPAEHPNRGSRAWPLLTSIMRHDWRKQGQQGGNIIQKLLNSKLLIDTITASAVLLPDHNQLLWTGIDANSRLLWTRIQKWLKRLTARASYLLCLIPVDIFRMAEPTFCFPRRATRKILQCSCSPVDPLIGTQVAPP